MKAFYYFLLPIILLTVPAFGQLSPWDAVIHMQKGINLGNTLEPPLEGGWNNPPAQEYYFDLYKMAGFGTVRIPVRWDEHTGKTLPYAIDESWMQRVEQIVDWALERDLFVVINAHHDDWIKNNYKNPEIRARFDSIWSQIAVRFKDKSEKLLFEILNEPYGLTKAQNDDMHARVLSIIRKTNPTRIVIFQGHNWGGSDELLTAAIPDDNYVMGSFHSYDPYLFGLEGKGTWGTSGDYQALENKFKAVKNWSDLHNIPVFLGEFGSLRSCDYNSRMKHYRAYVELSRKYNFISCAWDDGGSFRIMERAARKWDEVKDILISTDATSPRISLNLIQDTIIKVGWSNAPLADSIYIEYRIPTESYKRIASLPADSVHWFHINATADMYHHYRIIASYGNGEIKYSEPRRIFMPRYLPLSRGFFTGSPHSIPGIIEAEDFDTGGEGLTWHETTPINMGGSYRLYEAVDIFPLNNGGFCVGHVWPGEWFEHTVDVETEGNYRIDFHVTAAQAGGSFILSIGNSSTDSLSVPVTQNSNTTTILSDTVHLVNGIQIMRFSVLSIPYFNIDKMEFTLIPEVTNLQSLNEENYPLISITGDQLLIQCDPVFLPGEIQIFDTMGRTVRTINNPDPLTMLSNFKGGLYLIRLAAAGKTLTRKVILPY